MTASTAATTDRFSAELSSRTTGEHGNAEHSPFMTGLLGGSLPLAGYVDLLAQLRLVYLALEEGADQLAANPVVAPFLDRSLDRVPEIDADLAYLRGQMEAEGWAPDQEFEPTSATEAYVARIREATATAPSSYIAHHYTRYLGDLSGGFHIGRLVARTYGLTPTEGGRYSQFDALGDPVAFKERYRALLDASPWSAAEKDEIVAEVKLAYTYNTELFASLDKHAA